MAKKETTEEKYRPVRIEYTKTSNITELGVQKYSDNYIIRALARKFFYSPTTIEKIIYSRV
ncbi:hypothetical protein C4S76_10610 [Apibacter adventoris]|nr:hypothetical protein C4S76_10610 [Apibacter adventoris]